MMQVEVRVVRARLWLSSSLFLYQDGLLSLTRVGETEGVSLATLRSIEGKDGDQCSLAEVTWHQGQKKCFRTVTAGWDDQGGAIGNNSPKFSLPEIAPAPGDSDRFRRKTNQETILPRLDFQLFLLRLRSRSRPQTVYIGTSGWQLSVKDVEALVSSREVVFLTTLQDDLGTLEVKLRCVNSNDSSRPKAEKAVALNDQTVNHEADAPTGFNINWSSSESLEKDLAEKARLKGIADKKLIAQLKQTATKAAKLLQSREYLIIHLHRSRAASRIQHQFRLLQNKKQEIIAKLRKEEEERIVAKKAKIRDKVLARNRERARAIRARLLEYLDNNHSWKNASPEDPASVQRGAGERLVVLDRQREQLVASKRDNASRSNQLSPQKCSDKLFDDELIRAVQNLHFTRTHSNQM